MRKILACAVGAILVASAAAGLSGCKGTSLKRAHYQIDGEYIPSENRLKASMTVTVPNAGEEAIESLSFELWPNAYREGAKYAPISELYGDAAYYDGASYGGIDVTSIEGAASYKIGGEDMNILSVKLEKPLFPDETASVTMGFDVRLAKVNHRLGVGERNVTLANFYPTLCARGEEGYLEYVYASCGDPFVSECADFDVKLTFPAEYEIAYGGAGEVSNKQGKKTLSCKAEEVRDVAFVLGKNLKYMQKNILGVCVEYYYLEDETPDATLNTAADCIQFFSESFGKYAYPKYALVETDFPYGGMEYSALAMISADLNSADRAPVVAHETAHQWWYSMVGSNQFEHAWLDEGLSEYSSALFLEAHPESGVTYSEFIKQSENGYRAYFSVKSQLSGEKDTNMNRSLTSFSGEYEYRNLAYDKGVIMLDRVRTLLGEKKFLAAMQRYFEENKGKIACPEDLIGCFKGDNVEDLFRSFVDGKCVI